MGMFALGLGTLCFLVGPSASFLKPYSKSEANCGDCNGVGEVLYLTPFLESGRVEDAKKAAKVPQLLENVTSYSGYLTVNKEYGSHIFFWFFPSEESPETAPVAMWMQGGPGCPSTYSIFIENGPFSLDNSSNVVRRSVYWSQKLNVLYIDQPVGTGFSFTESVEGYARNEDDVSRDVVSFLHQFFQLFPEFQNNEFFLTGESYAGKYIPAVGARIHQLNSNSSERINLKGVAIGNGWVDPYSMIDYSNVLYDMDLIDLKTKNEFKKIEDEIRKLIQKGDHKKGNRIMGNHFDNYWSILWNVTGIENVYNYLAMRAYNEDFVTGFLNQSKIRSAIHVGNTSFTSKSHTVYNHLYLDFLVSTIGQLEVLMDNYRVLLYNGQLDIICAYSLTMNYVRKLKWKGADDYASAERKQWYVGNDLAGYSKTAGNFTELLVRDAGHMVPLDQPFWAFEMITDFTFNRPLNHLSTKLEHISI